MPRFYGGHIPDWALKHVPIDMLLAILVLIPFAPLFIWSGRSLIAVTGAAVLAWAVLWFGFGDDIRRLYGSRPMPDLFLASAAGFSLISFCRALGIRGQGQRISRLLERLLDLAGTSAAIALFVWMFSQEPQRPDGSAAADAADICPAESVTVAVGGEELQVPMRAGFAIDRDIKRGKHTDLGVPADRSLVCAETENGTTAIKARSLTIRTNDKSRSQVCQDPAPGWEALLCDDAERVWIKIFDEDGSVWPTPAERLAEARKIHPWKAEARRVSPELKVTHYADGFLVLDDAGQEVVGACGIHRRETTCHASVPLKDADFTWTFWPSGYDWEKAFVEAYAQKLVALKLLRQGATQD